MKQLILFIVIFVVGVVSYPFLNSVLSSITHKMPSEEKTATTTIQVEEETPITKNESTSVVEDKKVVVVDEQGAVHDGPFPVLDADGKETTATAQIIRSPEETVLQFQNIHFMHSSGAQIYIATDTKATKYMNLGQASLNAGAYVYGLPLDINLDVYKYILIFNPDTNVVEFFTLLK